MAHGKLEDILLRYRWEPLGSQCLFFRRQLLFRCRICHDHIYSSTWNFNSCSAVGPNHAGAGTWPSLPCTTTRVDKAHALSFEQSFTTKYYRLKHLRTLAHIKSTGPSRTRALHARRGIPDTCPSRARQSVIQYRAPPRAPTAWLSHLGIMAVGGREVNRVQFLVPHCIV